MLMQRKFPKKRTADEKTPVIPEEALTHFQEGRYQTFIDICGKAGLDKNAILKQVGHFFEESPDKKKVFTEALKEFFQKKPLLSDEDKKLLEGFAGYYFYLIRIKSFTGDRIKFIQGTLKDRSAEAGRIIKAYGKTQSLSKESTERLKELLKAK